MHFPRPPQKSPIPSRQHQRTGKILCFKRGSLCRGLLLPAAGLFFLQGVACFGGGSLLSRIGAGAASAARRAASSPGLRSAANMAKESWEREVTGTLFKYGDEGQHVALYSGPPSAERIIIALGGLTDGMLATPYTQPLSELLPTMGWGMVQPLLASSHLGYGISSLKKDAKEIDMLIKYLSRKGGKAGSGAKFVILGHSTGCQDAVAHCKSGKEAQKLCGIVLQAPVSDREYAATKPETAEVLALAQSMVDEAKGRHLMPVDSDLAPITANRFVSLNGALGDDDMFSSDLTDEQLRERLGCVKVPCMIVMSMADEYVPPEIDKEAMAGRISKAVGGEATVCLVEGGDHALYTGTERFLEDLKSFLEKL